MGHAQHFLERLPRIGDDHVQRALSLYYSSAYTQSVIHIAFSPDTCDPDKAPEQPEQRVAIALDSSPTPPFIIANRAGRMITCLAPGMSPYDTPVIDHARLGFACDRHDTLKGREAAYAQLRENRANIMLPLIKNGWAVSRSTFRGLSFLAPWLQIQFFASSLKTGIFLATQRPSLAKLLRKGQINRTRAGWVDPRSPPNVHPHIINRHSKAIDAYWSQLWFGTHTALLACTESPGLIFDALTRYAAKDGTPFSMTLTDRLVILNVLTDDGFLPQLIRALWILGAFGELVVEALEFHLHHEHRVWEALTCAAGLAVIGLRHPHLHTQVCNIITRYKNFEFPQQSKSSHVFMHAMLSDIIRILENPSVAAASNQRRIKQSQHTYAHIHKHHSGAAKTISDQDALSFFSFFPVSMHIGLDDSLRITSFIEAIPWVASANVEDLYAPDDQIPLFKGNPRRSCVDALLGFAASLHGTTAFATPPDDPSPSRNDPCPCGSNKKYKMCCLHKKS